MKVKLLKKCGQYWCAGEVRDVMDELAKRLVAEGKAEPVEVKAITPATVQNKAPAFGERIENKALSSGQSEKVKVANKSARR
jgi:hypothetical protein